MPTARRGVEPPARHLLTPSLNNAWADPRRLGASAPLTRVEFEAPCAGFLPSVSATPNHHLTVDGLYLDAIERSLAAQALCDCRLHAMCESLDGAALAGEVAVLGRAAGRRLPRARLQRSGDLAARRCTGTLGRQSGP